MVSLFCRWMADTLVERVTGQAFAAVFPPRNRRQRDRRCTAAPDRDTRASPRLRADPRRVGPLTGVCGRTGGRRARVGVRRESGAGAAARDRSDRWHGDQHRLAAAPTAPDHCRERDRIMSARESGRSSPRLAHQRRRATSGNRHADRAQLRIAATTSTRTVADHRTSRAPGSTRGLIRSGHTYSRTCSATVTHRDSALLRLRTASTSARKADATPPARTPEGSTGRGFLRRSAQPSSCPRATAASSWAYCWVTGWSSPLPTATGRVRRAEPA